MHGSLRRHPGHLDWLFAILVLASAVPSLAEVSIAELEPSVVRVVARLSDKVSTGSGVVIDDSGVVATNQHVIANASQYGVLVPNSDELFRAEVIWSSGELDLALLKTEIPEPEPATLLLGEPEKGSEVIAIGYPGIADRLAHAVDATVTRGIVSRILQASWNDASERPLRIIQHSAEISGGNSGGPLFDTCGRVVAVNTQQSVGRAIVDLDSGEGVVVPAAGVYFGSMATELAEVLKQRGIEFMSTEGPCTPSSAAAPWVQALVVSLPALLIAALAMLFALRKPRQAVVGAVQTMSQRISPSRRHGSDGDVPGRRGRAAPGVASKRGGSARIPNLELDAEGGHIEIEGSELDQRVGGIVLGRSPDLSDQTLDEGSVSRRHARLYWDEGTFFIEDLNSSHGTSVRGQVLAPFAPVPLQSGDSVAIGDAQLEVRVR